MVERLQSHFAEAKAAVETSRILDANERAKAYFRDFPEIVIEVPARLRRLSPEQVVALLAANERAQVEFAEVAKLAETRWIPDDLRTLLELRGDTLLAAEMALLDAFPFGLPEPD